MNHEALLNFGGEQLKKDPRRSPRPHQPATTATLRGACIFYGNSQGGHEGLVVAQRYGADYDGVVAIHPAYAFTELQLSGLHAFRKPSTTNRESWPSPEKLKNICRCRNRKMRRTRRHVAGRRRLQCLCLSLRIRCAPRLRCPRRVRHRPPLAFPMRRFAALQ